MFEIMPFSSRKNELYDPFRTMEHMMNHFWGDAATTMSAFKTDLKDTGENYVLEAELPGFHKEDIKLDLDGDTLTISAEHADENEDKSDSYLRRERFYGSYQRSFDMSEIQTENIAAAYENGVLTLTLPKKAPAAPTSRRLEIQ